MIACAYRRGPGWRLKGESNQPQSDVEASPGIVGLSSRKRKAMISRQYRKRVYNEDLKASGYVAYYIDKLTLLEYLVILVLGCCRALYSRIP